MTDGANSLIDEGGLVRRMHRARVRQWVIASTSVLVTVCGLVFLTPAEISPTAYYILIALMLLNAVVALLQSVHVIFPIETLLKKIRRVERDVDKGRLDIDHFTIHSDDAFACLTAGLDNLIQKLLDKTRTASERMLLNAAMLQATPFTIFTVSRTGKVFSVVRDIYGLVPLLGIKTGSGPDEKAWGKDNADKFLGCVAKSFSTSDFIWFDIDVGTHHLRGCVKHLNELTALVEIGDLPAIDALVSGGVGQTSASDFSHYQTSLKRFAASIAHDAKNIFAVINNLVELNKKTTDPAVRNLIPIAEDAIRRGTNLMMELSTFAGETRLSLVCTPATEGLKTLVENSTIQALLPKNVHLVSSISSQPMPEIDLDADQIWKVGFNLVKNAVEAMNGHAGHIWINVEPYRMTDRNARLFRAAGNLHPGSGVLVTIADDGPGIPAKMLEHVFDPYYSSKGAGRGIGLTTVVAIVQAHNGALNVKSSPGSGTTFSLYFPASRNTAAELQLIREVAPNGEILLVDDDPTILHTTSLVLRTLKIAAHPAGNEADALTKLRTLRARVSAVLVDANLNGVSSTRLVRHVHEEFPNLPVIVVSGSPKETIDEQFGGVPYDRFLGKPYSVAELSAALEGVRSTESAR